LVMLNFAHIILMSGLSSGVTSTRTKKGSHKDYLLINHNFY
jgi:hypothetical protein